MEDITQEMFREFQSTTLPFILRGGAIKHGDDENEDIVTNKQLENFEHAIEISTYQCPKFDSQVHNWLPFKKKFMSVVKTHNIESVLDKIEDETFSPLMKGPMQGISGTNKMISCSQH